MEPTGLTHVLEVMVPHQLLDACHQLQADQKTTVHGWSHDADASQSDVTVSLSKRKKHFHMLFKGSSGYLTEIFNNHWKCDVQSVAPPGENGENLQLESRLKDDSTDDADDSTADACSTQRLPVERWSTRKRKNGWEVEVNVHRQNTGGESDITTKRRKADKSSTSDSEAEPKEPLTVSVSLFCGRQSGSVEQRSSSSNNTADTLPEEGNIAVEHGYSKVMSPSSGDEGIEVSSKEKNNPAESSSVRNSELRELESDDDEGGDVHLNYERLKRIDFVTYYKLNFEKKRSRFRLKFGLKGGKTCNKYFVQNDRARTVEQMQQFIDEDAYFWLKPRRVDAERGGAPHEIESPASNSPGSDPLDSPSDSELLPTDKIASTEAASQHMSLRKPQGPLGGKVKPQIKVRLSPHQGRGRRCAELENRSSDEGNGPRSGSGTAHDDNSLLLVTTEGGRGRVCGPSTIAEATVKQSLAQLNYDRLRRVKLIKGHSVSFHRQMSRFRLKLMLKNSRECNKYFTVQGEKDVDNVVRRMQHFMDTEVHHWLRARLFCVDGFIADDQELDLAPLVIKPEYAADVNDMHMETIRILPCADESTTGLLPQQEASGEDMFVIPVPIATITDTSLDEEYPAADDSISNSSGYNPSFGGPTVETACPSLSVREMEDVQIKQEPLFIWQPPSSPEMEDPRTDEFSKYRKYRNALIQYLETHTFPPGFTKAEKRNLANQAKTHTWDHEREELHYKLPNSDHAVKVVPDLDEIERILQQYHIHPTGSHRGVNNTLSKISNHYTWRGMKKDIQHYVQSCDHCQNSEK